MSRLWTRLTCSWFVLGLWCARKGHDWREEYAGCCVKATVCCRCGHYRGARQWRECSGIHWTVVS